MMLRKLAKADYDKVEQLFEALHFQLFCPAVIANIDDGDIYVDNLKHPQTAFMITRSSWGYLAGDPNNEAFNQALNKAIFSHSILDEDAWGLMLSCHPEDWETALEAICAPREPLRISRLHFITDEINYDWRSQIPDGYIIRPIERDILQYKEIPEDVKNMIASWDRIEDPAHHGIGYVALKEGKITAHAVIDCIVGQTGDMGLVTDPGHRRRGLATIISAASIEQALKNGLTKILWDAAEHNIPSVRTAQKLGLKFQEKHVMYMIDFDEVWHQISLAVNRLDDQRYGEAIEYCQKLIGMDAEIPPLGYFVQATAHAGKGQGDLAFECFDQAIEAGWTATNYTQSRTEWQPFHGTTKWKTALKRMQATL